MGKDNAKLRKHHKVKTSGGYSHNFTAKNVSLNKLASKKLNVTKLQRELETERSLLDAADIPIE